MIENIPLEQLKRALDAGLFDEDTYRAAIAGMNAQLTGAGAIAQGPSALAAGAASVVIPGTHGGDINTGLQLTAAEGAQIVYAEQGASVVIGEAPVAMTAVERQSAFGRYLQHLINERRI